MPMVHRGHEIEEVPDIENSVLDRVVFDQFLAILTDKEQETIEMWAQGWTLVEIAAHISCKYDGREKDNPLSPRTFGVRIHKILQRLRLHRSQLEQLPPTWLNNTQSCPKAALKKTYIRGSDAK